MARLFEVRAIRGSAPAARNEGCDVTNAMIEAANSRLIPDVLKDVGARATESSAEHAVIKLPLSPAITEATGVVFGGVLMMLADAAAGLLVTYQDGPADAVGISTTMPQMNVNIPRNTRDSTVLRAESRYVRRGRRVSLVETSVFDDEHRLLLHATSHHVPIRRTSAPGGPPDATGAVA